MIDAMLQQQNSPAVVYIPHERSPPVQSIPPRLQMYRWLSTQLYRIVNSSSSSSEGYQSGRGSSKHTSSMGWEPCPYFASRDATALQKTHLNAAEHSRSRRVLVYLYPFSWYHIWNWML